MVRRRACAVSNHEATGLAAIFRDALRAPQDEDRGRTDDDILRALPYTTMLNRLAARVIPVYQQDVALRNAGGPGQTRGGRGQPFRRIVAFSFSPDDDPLTIGDPGQIGQQIRSPGSVLFDRDSRPIYGDIAVGSDVEFGNKHWQVDGLVNIGPDIINDGTIVMSSGNAREKDQPIMGVRRITVIVTLSNGYINPPVSFQTSMVRP